MKLSCYTQLSCILGSLLHFFVTLQQTYPPNHWRIPYTCSRGSARACGNHKLLLDRQSSGPGGLKEVSLESGSPCVFSVMHLLERDKWWSDAFWVLREVKLQDFSGLIKLVSVVEWKINLLSDPLKSHQYQENKSRLSYPSFTHRCKCAWGEVKRNPWQPAERGKSCNNSWNHYQRGMTVH